MASNKGWILTSLAIFTSIIVSITTQDSERLTTVDPFTLPPPFQHCEFILNSNDTWIESPGKPFSDPNLNCTWKFNTSDTELLNRNIFFTFNSLMIGDGDSLTVTGNEYHKVFNSTSDQFVMMVDSSAVFTYITGKSDEEKKTRGFSAGMKIDVCEPPANEKGAIGVIKYPVFLSKSNDTVDCKWSFNHADVSFTKFKLKDDSDVLIIATNPTSILNRNYTGTALPPDAIGTDITITLFSNTNDSQASFELNFIPVDPSCSETRNVPLSYPISNPRPPFLVQHQDCVTILMNEDGPLKGRLVTDFKDAHDSVIINSGGGRFSPNIRTITKQSANRVNYLLTENNFMWIEFSSEQLVPFSSFNLTVEALDAGGLIRDEGSFKFTASKDISEVPFGLVVADKKQVFLQLNYSFAEGEELIIYDDLVGDKVLLQVTDASTKSMKIFGNTNEMLVVAKPKVNSTLTLSGHFEGTQTPSGCYMFITESSGAQTLTASPDNKCSLILKPEVVKENGMLELTISPSESDVQITVYEGITENKRTLINNVLGSEIPKTGVQLYILANIGATIEYQYSKTSKAFLPFTVTYNSIPSCVQSISLTTKREITSPNYPNVYPLNANCVWDIKVPEGKLIHVVFNNLSLPNGNSITIIDSKGATKPFSGFVLPDDLIIERNMSLYWSSDLDIKGFGGFSINLTSIDCGGNFDRDDSFLTTNVSQQSCVWSVILPEDKNNSYIKVSFVKNTKLNESSEKLIFHDGGSVRDPVIPNEKVPFTTKSKKLLITYDLPSKSKGSVYNVTFSKQDCTGSPCKTTPYCMQDDWICNGKNDCEDFSDEKYCAPETDCGFNITINEIQTINSADIIKDKKRSLNCLWSMKAPKFSSMLITIQNISLVNDNDILKIEDPEINDTLHVSSYLVQGQGDYIVTTKNSANLRLFSSPLSHQTLSFILKVQPQANGRRINFPNHKPISIVANQTEETYVLTADANKQVLVKLNKTVDHLNGTKISFYDGTTKNKVLASFNEKSQLYPVFSTSNEMLVVINSTLDLELQAEVESVTGCYEIQTELTGYFSTKDLLADEKCIWLIKRTEDVETGTLVLNVETLTDTSVTIFNHLDDNSTLIKLDSSSLLPYTLHVPYVDGVRMEVKRHRKNDSTAEQGIAKINYEVNPKCISVYNLTSNVTITSPGYPHMYPFNADCRWTFNIPEDKLVHIQFIDMDLHKDHKVEVGYNVTSYGNYSEQILPDDIVFFNQSSAFMAWRSNHNTSNIGRGFKVLVEIIDCGGIHKSGKAAFEFSPKAPNETTYCIWLIDIPAKDSQTKYTNIIQYNIKSQITDKNLEIHDGGQMINTSLPIELNKDEQSRTNKLVVKYFYEYKNNSIPPLLNFNYLTHGCNETCRNGICLKPLWKCNGINECEDFTDEYNCTQYAPTPSPSPSPSPGGVSTGWFVAGIFIALACGVILAVLVPKLIRKYRPNNSHSRLINESDS